MPLDKWWGVPPYAPPPEYTPPPADVRAAIPPQIAKDLIAAVKELEGHALALTLVGNYLAGRHHGDIRAIHDLPSLAELRDAPERSPYRVMRAIEIALARRIEEEGKTEKPVESVAGRELALLFFLGLFDRPAEMAHLSVVFPQGATQVLQPDSSDLALSSKKLIPIKKRLHELKQELLTDLSDWRKEEVAQETIAARGPMPLFMADAHLLRARIALSQNNLAAAKAKCDAGLELIQRHGYGRAAPEAAVLNAEIACAENAAYRDAAIAAAVTAIRGEPYHDEGAGIAIDGGWWGLLPRLELLLPTDDPRLADLRAARDAYNAERDAYLRSTLAKDVKDYNPANDPIAAYLGVDVWEEEDRALADPDFRRELSEALVFSGYKPLDETPIAEQRNDARNYLKQKREAQGKKAAVKQKRGRF
jgi:hypothetical protein